MPSFPELFRASSGDAITTPAHWPARRAELLDQLERGMFGRMPALPTNPPTIRAIFRDERFCNGAATLHGLAVELIPGIFGDLLLSIPNGRRRPPVIAGLNFFGNHTACEHPDVPICASFTEQVLPRGADRESWQWRLAAERGWAVATMCMGDIAPDSADPAIHDAAPGIHRALRRGSLAARGPEAWGGIAAWSFGLRRIVDHLCQRDDLDAGAIALVGHSRLGKTALLAGALDARAAVIIANQSGTGGAAPSRKDDPRAESLAAIVAMFPHWFCPALQTVAATPAALPFDQHALLALIAPRPLLLSNASDDHWADPPGQYAMLDQAAAAWRLFGRTAELPAYPSEHQLIDGSCGWFRRPGEHSVTATDWTAWLDFADRHRAAR